MSKTAHFPHDHVSATPSGREHKKFPSSRIEGHHIRQAFLAATVLSWVGIAYSLSLF